MSNRVMKAKALKLRNQRRRYPRRMDLDKRGPRPNIEVIREYKQRSYGLGDAELPDDHFKLIFGRAPFKGVPTGKHEINQTAEVTLRKFDNPLHVTHIDNHVQKIDIFFNSRQDQVVIRQLHRHQRVYRISGTFSNIDDAYFALEHNVVTWKVEKPFPNPEIARS